MEFFGIAESFFKAVASGLELVGTVVIVLGAVYSLVVLLNEIRRGDSDTYNNFRKNLGRSILLGLEFLVAGDIVGTVAIRPDFENLGALALIVIIRTFLSFTIEVELHGRWPWQTRT